MAYLTRQHKNGFLFIVLISISSQIVFASPNISNQISRQINRANSQAISKNISDRMIKNVKNKSDHARIHTRKQISEAQKILHDLGYKPGKIDGLIGRKTRKAIVAFQQTHKLKGDGLLTVDLLQKLHQSNR